VVAGRRRACPPGAGATALGWRGAGVEQVVDLAGEVPLETADDLEFGVAFDGSFRDVGLGLLIHPQAADDGEVQRRVGLPVAAAVDSLGR
jgi:hypothetical protein